MENIVKKIPIALTQILNKFNEQLTKIRNEINMEASLSNVGLNNQRQINISYRLKNTDYYFNIFFTTTTDLIYWTYYPYARTSTNSTSVAQVNISNSGVLPNLMNSLINWKQHIEDFKCVDNPINYFLVDDFIKFYSDEIQEEIPEIENESIYPLSSAKQVKALNLIELQIEFINNEINDIGDQTSEKYYDLINSKKLIERIKEDLPRITVAELKRNWSISLAGIKKWCNEKFLQFLNMDKETEYDLSRSLGSFIGGILGVPKLDN